MPLKQIRILGGGVGALSTAWQLTEKPGWQSEYEITLYQMGWRLGGKGASSRNASRGARIEEHGLHVWFGFYENAFSMMRDCYADPDLPADPLYSFAGAFRGQDLICMMEQVADRWQVWPLTIPPHDGEPGLTGESMDIWEVIGQLLETVLDEFAEQFDLIPDEALDRALDGLGKIGRRFLPRAVKKRLRKRALRSVLASLHKLHRDSGQPQENRDDLLGRLDRIIDAAREHWQPRLDHSDKLRHALILLELGIAVIRGLFADDVLRRGLRSIDDMEFSQWLRKHGASEFALASSALRALYDCCFAWTNGDTNRRSFAAGAALGCALRIGLTYRGHVLYEMQAGMGDIVIAPLYRVLAARGVKFEFFQKVRKLEVGADKRRIARVHFTRQATPIGGDYQPLEQLPGIEQASWPDHPLYAQLVEGDQLRDQQINLESHWSPWPGVDQWTLDLGPDDELVLGISLGALEPICAELGAISARWNALLNLLPSIQTQSMQLWMKQSIQDMGWTQGSVPPAMVAAPEVHDVWAEMSHLLAHEFWPPGNAPKSLQYFCGPLKGDYLHRQPDNPGVPALAQREVRHVAIDWLNAYARWLWPNAATGNGEFNWGLLDGGNASGPDRIDDQYLRANIDPSERYVLSPAELNHLRIDPDDSGFENLVLAGDWTRTPINAGCVEGAVMSGMAASRKLCGFPEKIAGEHFLSDADLPSPKRRKVAILGGGCAALSAAWWLTETAQSRSEFEITIYTPGWRLGGKAANGRDAAQHQRILEHGLHMMMGFYDITFRTVRDAYDKYAPGDDAAFQDWRDAFEPLRQVSLWLQLPDATADQAMKPWTVEFPQLPGTPGDRPLEFPPDDGYLLQAVQRLLRHLLDDFLPYAERHTRNGTGLLDSTRLISPITRLLSKLADALENLAREAGQQILSRCLRQAQKLFKRFLAPRLLESPVDEERFKAFVAIDLALAVLIGLLRDVLPQGHEGFERINDREFKDWLRFHGASIEAVHSPVIMCIYDLAFAYPGGDSSRPENGKAAAGAMMHLLIRMALTYQDAPLWRMRAGMGDVIFTPMFEVLKRRGVRFRFFSEVTSLHLSNDEALIESIDVKQQASVKGGKNYQPTVDIAFNSGGHWPCWPDQPDWEQLENGAALQAAGIDFEDPWTQQSVGTNTLRRGHDFDELILAIPPAAADALTRELRVNLRWAAMIDNATSVATLSCQLWLEPDLEGLGWKHGQTVATGQVAPLKSWASMDQLHDAEDWPATGSGSPRSIAYLCGTFTPEPAPPAPGTENPDYVPGQNARVEQLSRNWFANHTGAFWPGVATSAGGLKPSALVSSYYRGNVQPSEQYVLSLPGSIRYRLTPEDSGFSNLYLAGDWTVTSINGGCAEAAFESGMRAAFAMRGRTLPTAL